MEDYIKKNGANNDRGFCEYINDTYDEIKKEYVNQKKECCSLLRIVESDFDKEFDAAIREAVYLNLFEFAAVINQQLNNVTIKQSGFLNYVKNKRGCMDNNDKLNDAVRQRMNRAKDDTYIGKFVNAALAQKSMVTNRIVAWSRMELYFMGNVFCFLTINRK